MNRMIQVGLPPSGTGLVTTLVHVGNKPVVAGMADRYGFQPGAKPMTAQKPAAQKRSSQAEVYGRNRPERFLEQVPGKWAVMSVSIKPESYLIDDAFWRTQFTRERNASCHACSQKRNWPALHSQRVRPPPKWRHDACHHGLVIKRKPASSWCHTASQCHPSCMAR
jgi:hypothetical protein